MGPRTDRPRDWRLYQLAIGCGHGEEVVRDLRAIRSEGFLGPILWYLPDGSEPNAEVPRVTACRDPDQLRNVLAISFGERPWDPVIRAYQPGDAVAREVDALVAEAQTQAAQDWQTSRASMGAWTTACLDSLPRWVGRSTVGWVSQQSPRPLSGIPAVVVGAGPSLDAALPRLAKLAPRAVVVAVGTACKPLVDHGIIPDLVVVQDVAPIHGHLEGQDWVRRSVGILGETVSPGWLALPWGERLLAVHPAAGLGAWLIAALGGEEAFTASGGSCSCLAACAASQLGCDPIVLVGVDLAPGEQLHATGTVHGRCRTMPFPPGRVIIRERSPECREFARQAVGVDVPIWDAAPAVEVARWGGGRIWTEATLAQYAHWMEVGPRAMTARRINASVGGVHLGGWEELALSEIGDDWPSKPDIVAVIREAASRRTISRRAIFRALRDGADRHRSAAGAAAAAPLASLGQRVADWMEAAGRAIDGN